MNSRRKLLTAIGAGALVSPFSSFAQQPGKVWRVGVLVASSRPVSLASHWLGAFPRALRELGYVEGKNLIIEWRFAENKFDRLPELATELVQLKVDVIVAAATPATRAAQKATTTIPIVMASIADPVGNGFINSLSRPGGNITGLSMLAVDISPKLLEMLHDMVPKIGRVAILVNPDTSFHTAAVRNIQAVAQRPGVTIQAYEARNPHDIEETFSQMARQKMQGLIVMRDAFFNQQIRQISNLATKNRLPAIAGLREYVDAGGLMSYGTNLSDLYRYAATYVDKIFKGAKPADLPVEQPTKLELVINARTAKALGLKIPQSLLISADRVIE